VECSFGSGSAARLVFWSQPLFKLVTTWWARLAWLVTSDTQVTIALKVVVFAIPAAFVVRFFVVVLFTNATFRVQHSAVLRLVWVATALVRLVSSDLQAAFQGLNVLAPHLSLILLVSSALPGLFVDRPVSVCSAHRSSSELQASSDQLSSSVLLSSSVQAAFAPAVSSLDQLLAKLQVSFAHPAIVNIWLMRPTFTVPSIVS